MKFAFAIFGLVGMLPAQIICRPVGSKSALDCSSMVKKVASADRILFSGVLAIFDDSQSNKCFERVQGTFALGNGEIVHELYRKIIPCEPDEPTNRLCSASRSREWLSEFSAGRVDLKPQEISRYEKDFFTFCKRTDN